MRFSFYPGEGKTYFYIGVEELLLNPDLYDLYNNVFIPILFGADK